MGKWLFSFIFLITVNCLAAQNKSLPLEVKPFVLPGYSMLDYVAGDLNADSKPDGILILKQNNEDTSYGELNRTFIILIRQANGKLRETIRNDSAILCFRCGGVFGDPYEGIEIAKKGFGISFYGGSSWRWGLKYSFTYNPEKSNWYLAHQHEASYNSTDIENTEKNLDIDAKELKEISINDFNANAGFIQTKWKVISAKTFFYTQPKLGSKPRKGYLVKGDKISSYRVLNNFVEVYFENNKQQSSSGFILKKDLVQTE